MSFLFRSQDLIREHVGALMPDDIKTLIQQAKSCLLYGPLYLDQDGEQCSPFDDTARPFDFSQACIDIANFFDGVGCLYLDEDGCVHTTEPSGWTETIDNPDYDPEDPDSEPTLDIDSEPVPYWEVSPTVIVRTVVGEMLAPYIA